MRTLFIALLLSLICGIATAQKSDIGNWFIYFGDQSIHKRYNWWNEIQYRNYNFVGDMEQLLLRTGIGYNLTEKNNNILLGYGFIKSQQYVPGSNNKTTVLESRIYEQFITQQTLGSFFLQHRYRIEERFISDNFLMRFRYLLSLKIPLNNKTIKTGTAYASVYNEVFINGQNTIFDRNRIYGALGYAINKHFKVEIGYMAQVMESSNRNQFQIALFNSTCLGR